MATPRKPKSTPAATKTRDGTRTFNLGTSLNTAIERAARKEGYGDNCSAWARKHLAIAAGFPLEKL